MHKRIGIMGLALAGLIGAGTASAQQVRTNDVLAGCGTTSGCVVDSHVVWGDDETEVILDGPVFVRDGGVLDLRAGVTLRGQPRYAGVVAGKTRGTPGVVVVTQSGEIQANGTNTPAGVIVMTTAAVDNDGDGVADDLDGNGFEDQWPGFTAACANGGGADAPEGPDNILGTGDDDLGTCVLDATPTFLDAAPRVTPLAPLNGNGDANVALWGGLVILGHAPTNTDGATTTSGQVGQGVVEGLPVPGYPESDATYGGVEPHDSSGTVRYVSVRHAGDEIGADNELNGVTLGGVGDGTTFSYVEVYANFDDGYEWFGGTVHSDHLVVEYVGDDSLDIDQGYTGTTQFALSLSTFFNEHDCNNADCDTASGGLYGSESGDKSGEWDGDDCGGDCNLGGGQSLSPTGAGEFGPWPFSSPVIYNYTVMGNDLNSVHVNNVLTPAEFVPNDACTAADTPWDCCTGLDTGFCTASDNRGIQMRNGFGGELRNSYVINTGTAEGLDIAGGGTSGWEPPDNVCADTDGDGFGDLIRVVTSTFDDVAALVGPGDCSNGGAGGDDTEALANGDAISLGVNANANLNSNHYNDVITRTGGPSTGGVRGLKNEDISFDPQGGGNGVLDSTDRVAKINPRPTSTIGFLGAIGAGNQPIPDPTAAYRGAFPSSGTLWTTGWTVMNIAELLED